MKQVININFQGRVVPIEVSAFELLKQYTESLNRHFAAEEGKEEIINDIENRIGELFQERLKEGVTCITDDDVNAVIRSMGRPEDLDSDEPSVSVKRESQQSINQPNLRPNRLYRDENEKVFGGVCSGLANYFKIDVLIVRIIFIILAFSAFIGVITYFILWLAVPSTASATIGGVRKKLYRDVDDKIIGGVCRGISHYFGINVWIPRLLFLLPLLTVVADFGDGVFDIIRGGFSPGSLIIYIILWLVIPEASTTAEKLEMKGEKVDFNSIKNSVVEEMKGVQQRAGKFGQEAGASLGTVSKRGTRTLGDIIALLFKIFAYFIIGSLIFFVVMALFGFGIVTIGLFPVKDFVLNDGWQNVFAWGTLIFFIATPIIGIITWLIRRLAKIKTRRRLMRVSFFSLWLVGLTSFILLVVSVGRDFRANSTINEQEITLVNPGINKLEITTNDPNKQFFNNAWLRLEPFQGVLDDTAYVGNISIHILKSTTDSFRVTMLKTANGRNRRAADTLASMINFNAYQLDSLLLIDRAIAVNRNDKFRNQNVILNVYVPVGKQIRIDKSVNRFGEVHITGGPWGERYSIDYDNEEHGWDTDIDYIMKADGLYTLEGVPADSWKNRERDDFRTTIDIDENGVRIDNYRYNTDKISDRLDSMERLDEIRQSKKQDSLKRIKDSTDTELNKISHNRKAAEPRENPGEMISSFATYNPMGLIMY